MRVSNSEKSSCGKRVTPAMPAECMARGDRREFLLSMVETRWAARNGDASKMEFGLKAQQELEKIEQQIAHLQAVPGRTRRPRARSSNCTTASTPCAAQMSLHLSAWEKTELARHPQRPYTLDYIERIFTDWSEIHGDRGFARRSRHRLRHGAFPRRRSADRRHRRRATPSRRSTATSACRIPRATARRCA